VPFTVVGYAGGRGPVALDPTLTDRGLTVPMACPPAGIVYSHSSDGCDDDDGGRDCTGVRSAFVPASRVHPQPCP